MTTLPILSTVVWTPVIFGFIALLANRVPKLQVILRYMPLVISLVTLFMGCWLISRFDVTTADMQFVEIQSWMPTLNIAYMLGVDGFSLILAVLTIFMTLLVIIAGFSHVNTHDYLKYCGTFLIMQGLMCGVFLALDAILFYVFFEAMMIPMFLIIGIWGGENRVYATIKFLLYTLFGSLFLLVSLIYLGNIAGTYTIAKLQMLSVDFATQKWLFWAILLAFAIKVPMWPVHTWLPDAHVEAPSGGSIILAAITLKIGGYGMLRFLLPILPEASNYFANAVIVLSLIAIAYIGLVSLVQHDLKKLIAYSSIAHMGFVTLGYFIASKILFTAKAVDTAIMSVDGAFFQMIAHGFVSGGLFLGVGVLYARMHTHLIEKFGGVVNSMPIFACFMMLFALANVGMPGTIGFVGEFLVILSSFKANVWCALIAATALVLGVAYTLWMYKRVIFGVTTNKEVSALQDITLNEKIACGLLAIAILLFGIWPNPIFNILQSSSKHLVTQIMR